MTVTQILASGLGGYVAGRQRTQWIGVHTDEIYFHDTAHGFLVWAVASLAIAALLTSVIGSILGTGVQATSGAAGGAVTAATAAVKSTATSGDAGPLSYLVDTLFRRDTNATTSLPIAATGAISSDYERSSVATAAMATESTKIFRNAIQAGALMPEANVEHATLKS